MSERTTQIERAELLSIVRRTLNDAVCGLLRRVLTDLDAAEETAERAERAEAEGQAAKSEADRWRHGQPIEGDYACPNAMEVDRLRGVVASLHAINRSSIGMAALVEERDTSIQHARLMVEACRTEAVTFGARIAALTKRAADAESALAEAVERAVALAHEEQERLYRSLISVNGPGERVAACDFESWHRGWIASARSCADRIRSLSPAAALADVARLWRIEALVRRCCLQQPATVARSVPETEAWTELYAALSEELKS